jgi:hypothetical protein
MSILNAPSWLDILHHYLRLAGVFELCDRSETQENCAIPGWLLDTLNSSLLHDLWSLVDLARTPYRQFMYLCTHRFPQKEHCIDFGAVTLPKKDMTFAS